MSGRGPRRRPRPGCAVRPSRSGREAKDSDKRRLPSSTSPSSAAARRVCGRHGARPSRAVRGCASSRARRSAKVPATGRRAGWRRPWSPAIRRRSTPLTRSPPGAISAGPRRSRWLVDEAPAAVQELRSRGIAFDLDPDGELALGLEGGHTRRRIVHSGGSATGHEITSKLAAMVAAEPRIEVREHTSAAALWSDGERATGMLTDNGPIAAAGDRAGDRRRRGAVAPDDQPARGDRRRPGPRRGGRAPTSPTSSSASSTRPRSPSPAPASTASLITEAIRGEGAKLLDADGERFTDELAPRDAVTAAILDRMRGRRQPPTVKLDLRGDRPGPLPQRLRLARRGRPRPARRAGPGRPGRPLHDGRGRGRPRRPLLPARPLRRRRVLLHRPPRRQPARLQLAQRVLRLRRPRRRARRSPRRPAAATRPSRPSGASTPPTQATRDAVWRRAGPMRNPDDLAALISQPLPAGDGDRRAAPWSGRESRGGHLRTDCPRDSIRRSTASTSSSAPTARSAARSWR